LPLALERSLKLTEKEGGWRLDLDYKLTNTGAFAVPWSWAAHPLFVVEAGDRIVLPESIHSLRLEGSGGERLGKGGTAVQWPIAKLASGGETDLSIVQAPDTGIGDKLFTDLLTESENWCALERPSARLRIKVSFDASATPYLGLWICYGGWPDRPGPKQVCVAPEPATAPVDSLARTGTWSRTLNPGQSSTWTMHVDFEVI
jgi:galactose mutarotase-like enzyme